jgi:hypothetical protein
VISGRNGTVSLIDRDNMGHQGAGSDNPIIQSLPGIFPNRTNAAGNFTAPVYFNGTLYFGAVSDTIQAFPLTGGLLARSANTYARPRPAMTWPRMSRISGGCRRTFRHDRGKCARTLGWA